MTKMDKRWKKMTKMPKKWQKRQIWQSDLTEDSNDQIQNLLGRPVLVSQLQWFAGCFHFLVLLEGFVFLVLLENPFLECHEILWVHLWYNLILWYVPLDPKPHWASKKDRIYASIDTRDQLHRYPRWALWKVRIPAANCKECLRPKSCTPQKNWRILKLKSVASKPDDPENKTRLNTSIYPAKKIVIIGQNWKILKKWNSKNSKKFKIRKIQNWKVSYLECGS